MKEWIQEELGNAGRAMAKKIHQQSRHHHASNYALTTMLQDMTITEAMKEPPQTHIANS
jgi:hypothetical protein